MRAKKVFVSGCFDMLHSGHVCFLKTAADHGELHLGIGADKTVKELKGRFPVNTQDERKYMLQALKCVKAVHINRGSGLLDFVQELKQVKPDVFVVNEDGNSPAKAALCRELGIKYLVLKRIPHEHLPVRSTTSLRKECLIPYRLDLAGGWLDQPSVSKFGAGPVLTISLEPTMEFNERSGLATSSRKRAIELWQTDLPGGDREKLAKLLFSYENPPGTTEFSGSQDPIGIVFPGLNRLDYRGGFWPERITPVNEPKILRWLEKHLYFVTIGPRHSGFRVRTGARITTANARALAQSADRCWSAILKMDLEEFGRQFRNSFEAQIRLFPKMMMPSVRAAIKQYAPQSLGWKLSGAGGGGYLVLVSEKNIPGAIQIKIRSDQS
ncbi:MAG: adenylyltransferase/cytidyltransferase family protein [Limisphaerales bacterium]